MKNRQVFGTLLISVVGVVIIGGSIVLAQAKEKNAKGAAAEQPEMKLPPGWTEADMQACILAGMPGKMQEHLAKWAGTWHGKSSMWMGPGGGEPMKGECTSTGTPIMDGRYLKVEMAGEMPGMGPFTGSGIYAFDNAAQQFVSTWIDNHSTGIMRGAGKLSEDGKSLTWQFTYTCPITKKPAVIREIDTITGPKTRTLESFGADPKSGKEFQMLRIEFTKK